MDNSISFEYFRTIAKTRNISAAADELGISQPALSAFIKRQETAVGSTLIDRSTIPLSLTEAGHAYLEYLEKVDSMSRELAHEIDDLDNLRKGSLTIGGAVFFNVTYLPAAIAEFNQRYPGISIEIVDGKVPEITSEALAGRIDLFTTPVPADEENFCYEEMLHEKIFLCLPRDWEINSKLPKAGKEGYAVLSDEDFGLLKDQTFIMLHDDQDIGRKMTQLFKKHDFEPAHVLMAGQTLTTLELTNAGVGISLITESTIDKYPASERPCTYLIDPEICSRSIYVAHPRQRYISAATREFIKVLLKHNR